jgi:diguanylate cyclase
LRTLARAGGQAAVIFIDIDRFRRVNDLVGERAADSLLAALSARVRARVRRSDVVARIGADRFAVLQLGISHQADIEVLANRLLADLRGRHRIADHDIDISVTLGIAIAPRDGGTAEDLMRRADLALTNAKSAGRDRFGFFASQLEVAAQKRSAIETGLRAALDGPGMDVVFQPKMHADGHTVMGVEALMRWPAGFPDRVTPDVFVPVAEETGLIEALSEQMWRKAINAMARWPNLTLALNLSPLQFQSGRLLDAVRTLLDETGFDPRRLEMEITEGILVRDAKAATASLEQLQALGVKIALDDFGTGYSGLSYLRDFPLDTIKIDQSFVRDIDRNMETAAIVQGVILIARTLGVHVVAEGVDSPAEHRFLQAAGCHIMQGFLFARPLTEAGLAEFLETHPVLVAA